MKKVRIILSKEAEEVYKKSLQKIFNRRHFL
jgi:putative transposon-encoded protein